MTLTILLVTLSGYLLGSIPSGYLIGRLAGTDIRKHGSGNIGATNVLRTLGKRFGYPVFFFDALKGFVAVWLGGFIAAQAEFTRDHAEWFAIAAAVACVLGHTFPIWLKFKGGKGVATSAGTMLGLAPVATLVAAAVWIIVFETTRYVSVASVAATVALPVTLGILLALHMGHNVPIFWAALVLAIVICWRHRSNLVRLVRGTEQRFTRQ